MVMSAGRRGRHPVSARSRPGFAPARDRRSVPAIERTPRLTIPEPQRSPSCPVVPAPRSRHELGQERTRCATAAAPSPPPRASPRASCWRLAMARYRGRHRAPSTTGRTLARTAIAGAVIGAPLAAAPAASADTGGTVWDRLAQCESTGNWNINTGNGFSGGLQFTPSTWRAFGGAAYASSAYKAGRSAQIAVAERVLASQGWGAWPACSAKLGLHGKTGGGTSAPK